MNLQDVIGVVTPQLNRAAQRMWSRVSYQDWLRFSYDMVIATASLLAEAVSESVRRGEGELAIYFAEQLTEEYGHDRWLAEDWAAAGGDPSDLTGRVADPSVARLIGTQYYWIRHAHPIALTGHIAVLEWHPPTLALVGELQRRTGLPPEAFGTLIRHAELDTEHGRRLAKLLETLPLDDFRQRLITTSAMTTAHCLVEMMIELGGQP